MNWLMRVVRFLFLIKEIISKEGIVHFRRYRLLSTPWFSLYIHQILQSDLDHDWHDHPWAFQSLILKGSYRETSSSAPKFLDTIHKTYYPGDVIKHQAEDVHKITLVTPQVWTLVLTSGRTRDWGYRIFNGRWVSHKRYRALKQEVKFGIKLIGYQDSKMDVWVSDHRGRFETPIKSEVYYLLSVLRNKHPQAIYTVEVITKGN